MHFACNDCRWRDMDGKSETRFMHDVGECFISVLVLGA